MVHSVTKENNTNDCSKNELCKVVNNFFAIEMKAFLKDVEPELTTVLGTHWTELEQRNSGIFAANSVIVLWQASKDPDFQ